MQKQIASHESCAPTRSKKRAGGAEPETCFSQKSLTKIAKKYNQFNPHDKIPLSKSKSKLWHSIRERIPECDTEKCWIKTPEWLSHGDKKDLMLDFKPPIPKGKNDWLATEDIDEVIDRYEDIFPHFRFLGTFPIDFQDVIPEAIRDLERLKRDSKVKQIGVVLNLDTHDQPGSHWVGVIIDRQKKTFEYFDSFADETPDEVYEFYSKHFPSYDLLENDITHQRENNECGNYSINFLVQRMSGRSFDDVTKDVIRDQEMNKKRPEFFDPRDPYDNS